MPGSASDGRTEVRPYDQSVDAGLLRSAAARIDEAERMLFDRVCKGGGWNHGNSNMLGAELRPYVSTSALALLALADKPAHPAVAESVRYLQQNRTTERSAMALGLTRIALGVFQQETDDVAEALQSEWRKAQYLGNLHVTALALYALAAADSRFEEFHVA